MSVFNDIQIDENLELEEKLRLNALKNCIPLNVTIELTQNCNFSCKHCYNFDRINETKSPIAQAPLKKEEVIRVIKEIRDAGGFYITFTGGESLLGANLYSYIKYSKDLGMSVRLKTNGALIDQKKATELKALGVDFVDVSLYGGNAKTHEEFTQSEGTFENVISGIRNLKENNISTTVNVILHKNNFRELSKMKEILSDLNVYHEFSLSVSARHDGTSDSKQYGMDLEDYKELFKTPEGRKLIEGTYNSSGNLQCACARSNCGIGVNGEVYPCIGAPLLSGNIREKSFGEIWKKSKEFQWIREIKQDSFEECNGCEAREYCGRSSGETYVNTGNYLGKDDATCERSFLIKEILS